VLGTLPPYALSAQVFRFRALAALAGRRPLGGDREVAVAAFVAARLVVGAGMADPLPAEVRASRVVGARAWLAAVAVPTATRGPLVRVIEATGRDDPAALGAALRVFIDAASRYLDAASRRELESLAQALEAP
jgi:hypothetical protein